MPQHVAIIMDGNRRWAEQRNLPVLEGHRAGAEAVRRALKACRRHGIRYLTLYAFSMENWQRPRTEVLGLMRLLREFLGKNLDQMMREKIRLRTIGRTKMLPAATRAVLDRAIKQTADHRDGELILAISYGGRAEIIDAAKKLAAAVVAGKIKPENIDEETFSRQLYAPDVPDPDLLIRTSGECRLSNFLLWQSSYSEIVVTDTLWPDFADQDFDRAVTEFQQRQRRFGKR
jgi:undecaprenyl diphosphate synthase